MNISFDTTKLADTLQEMTDRVVTQGKRRAVRAGARVIRDAMVEAAPVQVDHRAGSNALEPGELKAHIRAATTTDEAGEPVGLAGPDGDVAYVAHFVEYGHRMVTGGKSEVLPGGRVRGPGRVHEEEVPPHPFLRPAFESSADRALDAVTEQLAKEIEGR